MVSAAVIAGIGAALGSAILGATLAYMRRLEGSNPALSWWAAALALTTVRQFVLVAGLHGETAVLEPLFEALVAVSAVLFLGGALIFVDRKVDYRWVVAGLIAVLLWPILARAADFSFFARTAPIFIGTALTLIFIGYVFLRYRREHPGLGYAFIGVAFIVWGFHVANYPFLRPTEGTLPWGLTVTQALTLAIALALIISAQRRQAAELRDANCRATNSALDLAETERRFRDFAEVSSDWLWEMGPDLRFTYVSDNVRQTLGIDPATSIGKRRDEFGDIARDDEAWQAHLRDLEARRPFRSFAYEYRMPDGRRRNIRISGKPLFDSTGRFAGYRGTGRDVTDETRAAELADRAQRRFVSAIDGLESGVALFDRDDRLVMCNPAFRSITQLDETVLRPGLLFEDYLKARLASGRLPLPPGKTPEAFIAERISHHRQPSAPIERRMVDGRLFHIREHRLVDGGCMIFLYDVTDTKQREQQLAEKTALLQSTLENMGEGISVFDGEMRLVTWNARVMELTGHPPSMYWVGTPLMDFVRQNAQRGEYGPGDPEERAREAYAIAILPHPQRHARWRSSGRYVEQRRNPMPNGGFVSVYSDFTDRKRAEDSLREAKEVAEAANRTKSGILANMSHELRTPLNAIIGFSDIIMRESFGPISEKRYLSYASDINDSGTHLLALINDILDVSKAEAGRIELSESIVDITDLFEASIRLVRPRAVEAGIELAVLPAEHLPRLRGDMLRLKQVLINLLSNAIKFTPAGGKVTLSAGVERDVFLRVTDTGIGMATQDIPKALSPFGQLDSSLARHHHGTGLGLPLSKALAELHGGRLEISSQIGTGTAATIFLPIARVLAA